MKKVFILFVVAIATISSSKIVCAGFPKVPLMERFTQASCGPCRTYNEAGYSSWVNANSDKVAIIHYHTSWPGIDPMYTFNTSLSATRISQYQSLGIMGASLSVPMLTFNGRFLPSGTRPNNTELTNAMNAEQAKTVPVKITPTITKNNSNVAAVKVEVFSETAMSNVRLMVFIVQRTVTFSVAPGSTGEKEFPFVSRFALPNINGENLTLSANQTIVREFTQDLSTVPQQGDFFVVAFLEELNSAHDIVQAGVSGKAEPAITVTLNVEPPGAGIVTGNGGFKEGEITTVTATPSNETFTFVNWTDKNNKVISTNSTFNIVVSRDTVLTANFDEEKRYNVTVTIEPVNSGTVTGLKEYYLQDEMCEITATANEGYRFRGWYSGATSNPNRNLNFKVTKNESLIARFVAMPKITSQTTSPLVLEIGDALILEVSATGDSCIYQWFKDDVEIAGATASKYTKNSVSEEDAGTYTCEVSNFAGEVTTSPIVVEITSSIADMAINNLTVNPNPTSDFVTVSFGLEKSCNVQIMLCDILGQELLQVYDDFAVAGNFTRTINIAHLAKGIYFLKIFVDGKLTVEKIVLN